LELIINARSFPYEALPRISPSAADSLFERTREALAEAWQVGDERVRSAAEVFKEGRVAEAQKAIAFLQQHHTIIDPTIALYEIFMRTAKTPLVQFEPGVAKVAPQLAEPLKNLGSNPNNAEIREANFQAYLTCIRALHRAGTPVVVGTDQAVPGHSVHRTMELFVDAGFTPMEALQAATIVSARAMGIDKETGTIEAGKRADVVVLGGNPLENISNVRKTERVMQGGVLFDCAALWKSVGFLP